MLSSNFLNDAKLRKGVRRVSIMVCGALAALSFAIGGCPVQQTCVVDADCDDGVACTTDTCTLGTCNFVANCATGTTCNLTSGACDPVPCATDADCDDMDACTGTETCVANACVTGVIVDCSDGDLCTTDVCDMTDGTCTNTAVVCVLPEVCSPTTGTCGVPCTADADCDDMLFCTGIETCDVVNGACVPGTDPCLPTDTCNEVDMCVAGGPGMIFELTTDITGDAFNGTTGNDTFNATVGTLQPIDILVGGGGNNDVLNATIAGVTLSPAGAPFVTLIDIDVVNLITLNTTTFNAINTAAIGIYNILASSTGSFTMTNAEANPVFTLGSGFARALNVTQAVVTGAADTMTVTLNGTASGCIVGTTNDAALETLNLIVAADSFIGALTTGTSFFGTAAPLAGANNVVVTGSGMLTWQGGVAADLVADTYNFTGFTGNTGVSMLNNPGATNVSTLPRLVRYTINDTVGAQNHAVTTAANHNNVTFDVLTIPALAALGTLGIIQGANNNDGATVNLGGAGTGSGMITAAATEFLTINSGGTTANAVAGVTTNQGVPFVTTTLTVLGAQNITLGTVTTDSLNGAALTGTMSATAAGSMQMTGGMAADTLTGSGAIDQINGGPGNDIIVGNAGADTIDGGAGSDSIDGGVGIDPITGGTGSDTLRVSAVAANGADRALWGDFDDTAATGDIININTAVATLTGTDNFATVATLQTHAGAGALAVLAATEIVVVTSATVADLTSANSLNGTNLLVAIGGAVTGAIAGQNNILIAVADAANNVGIYYVSSADNALINTEMTLIVVLSGANVTLANLVFNNFTNAL